SLGLFAGTPTWTPDGSALLVGRQPLSEGGDDGLWLVDVGGRSPRRVVKPMRASFPMNEDVKISPGGRLAASFGGATGAMEVQIVRLSSWRRLQQPGNRGFLGVADGDWLNDRNLLLGVTSRPGGAGPCIGAGGL